MMIKKKTPKQPPSRVTREHLSGLGNMEIMFAVMHPEGLSIEEVREKAKERNFYRIVLQHVSGGADYGK